MSTVLVQLASPERMENYGAFKRLVDEFRSLVRFVEPSVGERLARVSCEECARLDEALVCYSSYAFTAGVAMAVSAVEARIVELIRKKNKRLYRSDFSRSTLGQLIQVFDDNQFKNSKYAGIKKLLPVKHKPLVSLLNQYRIFSVHPKGEVVSAQMAESILNLAFAFVLDKDTCPYTAAELRCAESGPTDT